jgi:protein-S-isoprenylcysteine O-methyltransferase Ste14
MGKNFTFDLAIRDHHKLITEGPYGIVRHPAYTGVLVVDVGLLMFYASPGSLIKESELFNMRLGQIFVGLLATVTMYIVVALRDRIQREEAALRREFGKDWEEWARKVPYCLVPGIY